MTDDLEELVWELVRHVPGATPEALAAIEPERSELMTLPADYLRFMLESNGAEGWVGGSHLNLWPVEAIAERDRGYMVQPGLLAFGDDGGGELYVFASEVPMRPELTGTQILGVPVLGPSEDRRTDASLLGSTFTGFLRHLAQRPPLDGARTLPSEIEVLLGTVDEQERLVLGLRFGLDRGEPRTIGEVGEHLGLSEDAISRVEKSALAKIRAAEGATGSR